MANLMLSVMGAFAEFEPSLIKERQSEVPTKGGKDSDAGSGVPNAVLALDYGISRETIYEHLR
jgi:hypothetical protein